MAFKSFYPVIFGGLIGYLTNWIAIKMLFWPKRPIFFLYGAIPKNKTKLAESIAITSTEHLFSAEEIAAIINMKLTPIVVRNLLNDLIPDLSKKIDTPETREEISRLIELKLKNIIGPSLSSGFASGLAQAVSINEFILAYQDQIVKFICDRVYPVLTSQATEIVARLISAEDIQKIISDNVKKMNEDEIESVIYKISSRELKLIKWSGGVLGVLIGIIQMIL